MSLSASIHAVSLLQASVWVAKAHHFLFPKVVALVETFGTHTLAVNQASTSLSMAHHFPAYHAASLLGKP